MFLLIKTYDQAYFKDVTNSFLPAAALLCKHIAKDRNTLIEQSFICVYQQINGSAISNKSEFKWAVRIEVSTSAPKSKETRNGIFDMSILANIYDDHDQMISQKVGIKLLLIIFIFSFHSCQKSHSLFPCFLEH